MRLVLIIAGAVWIFLLGCKNDDGANDLSTDRLQEWRNANFDIRPIGSFNFTDDEIADLYVMQPEVNDIESAAHGSVGRPTPRTATSWEVGSSGPAMAWDRRWNAPKIFKVWWQRVYDSDLYAKSGPYPKQGSIVDPYDPYTVEQTRPGSAWCEGKVEIKEPFGEPYGAPFPNLVRREVVLYFYPDGTVRGSLEFDGYRDIKLFDISRRDDLPVLRGVACQKEVRNPYFGKRRPRTVN